MCSKGLVSPYRFRGMKEMVALKKAGRKGEPIKEQVRLASEILD